MNDSNIKMVSSVKAVLLAVALLAANAAWSQPYAASKNWNRSDAVPISKAMACLLKSAESTFCASDAVCVHRLMRLRPGAGQRILLIFAGIRAKRLNFSQFRPSFRAESPAPAGISILWLRTQSNKPSKATFRDALVTGFRMAIASEIVWPRYAYEINLNSDNLVGICQLLEQIEQNAAVSTSEFKLYAQNSSGTAKSEELELWRVCNSDSSAEAQGIYNDFLEETSNYDSHYLVTETRVRSLELGTQTLEFDTLIWPDNAEEPGIYNYFLREASDYDNYYLVTESPVPHLDLNTRVWLGDTTSYSSVMLN